MPQTTGQGWILRRFFVGTISALLVSVTVAASESKKVASLVTVACDSQTLYGWTDPTKDLGTGLEADVWKLPAEWQHRPDEPRRTVRVASTTCGTPCLFVRVDLDEPLVAGTEYLVRLRRGSDLGGGLVAAGFLDTSGKATLSHIAVGSGGVQTLSVAAPVRLQAPGDIKLRVAQKKHPDWTVDDLALVRPPAAGGCSGVTNPRGLGSAHVEIAFPSGGPPLAGTQLTLVGLVGPFGEVTATGKYGASVPKTEKEAEYYMAVSYLGSDEKADVFGLDLKIAPALKVRRNWQLGPRLVADLAKNADSPNSAKLGFVARHSAFPDAGPITLSTWSFGLGAEADRDLDRVNGVFDLGWEPRLAALEHSRELRLLREAKRLAVAPSEVPLPPWGWGLEPKIGVEIGRSLRRQTFRHAESGQRLEIDAYDILRPFASLHGYVEWKRWTLDLSGTLRYLAEDEPTVRTTDDTLTLRESDGFEPYIESKLSYAIDAAGHQVLEVTYKNGSLPPTFERTDAFSLGIAVKY